MIARISHRLRAIIGIVVALVAVVAALGVTIGGAGRSRAPPAPTFSDAAPALRPSEDAWPWRGD